MPPKSTVTLAELEQALQSPDATVRAQAMSGFARSEVAIEAISALLQGLTDSFCSTVCSAADALGKLGPAALGHGQAIGGRPQVVYELLNAACHVQRGKCMPLAYEHCLEALLKIDPKNPFVIGLIHDHLGLTNWYPLKASLQGLRTIGTPDALDLLQRAAAFWMPELDKKQRRIVEEIVAGKR